MDIDSLIEELRAERIRLDEIIITLERLRSLDLSPQRPGKRGRKYMDSEDRREVSLRMKKYWEQRRNKTVGAESAPDGPSPGEANNPARAAAASSSGML